MPDPAAPAKPADADLIPWSQQAVIGDNPLDARWYIPFIRAINERLRAINVPPIAEDTLHYWTPSSSSNPTLWGLNAINGGFGGGGFYGNRGSGPISQIGTGLGIPFTPDNQESNPCSSYPTIVSATSTSLMADLATADGDPDNPDQSIPTSHFTLNTPTFLISAGWIPIAGDKIALYSVDLNPGGFPDFNNIPLPLDFAQLLIGYSWIYSLMQSLACYFVDPHVTFDGKTRPQIQSLLSAHQDWWDHFQGNALHDSASGLGDHRAGEFFFNLQLCSIFQTQGPYWPLRSDIAPGDSAPADWPPGVPFFGFTRKREREITTLSDPGAEGQVARFIFSLSPQWDDGPERNFEDPRFFGPPDWNFPDPNHPPTPADEKKYARQVMLYQGGQWIVHPDATVQPDIVTFYGSPRAGDIFGHWFLNELKAAINLLTVSLVQERIWSGRTTDVHGVKSGPLNAAAGEDASSYSHTATTATTEAVYMANQLEDGGEIYAATLAGTDLSGPFYQCESSCAKLYIYSPAHGMHRDVTFYLASEIPSLGAFTNFVFDAAGLAATGPTYSMPDGTPPSSNNSLTLGAIWKVGTIAATGADHVDWTGYVGSLPKWLPSWPSPAAVGDPPNSRGIGLFTIGCTCNWKVAGGFQYVGS